MTAVATEKRVRTTVSLPASLLELLDGFLKSERRLYATRTDLLESALREYLAHLERQRIDLQFADMAFDEHYLVTASKLADDFEGSELPID